MPRFVNEALALQNLASARRKWFCPATFHWPGIGVASVFGLDVKFAADARGSLLV
jgi:hypothetical protein